MSLKERLWNCLPPFSRDLVNLVHLYAQEWRCICQFPLHSNIPIQKHKRHVSLHIHPDQTEIYIVTKHNIDIYSIHGEWKQSVPLPQVDQSESHSITCASLDPRGQILKVYQSGNWGSYTSRQLQWNVPTREWSTRVAASHFPVWASVASTDEYTVWSDAYSDTVYMDSEQRMKKTHKHTWHVSGESMEKRYVLARMAIHPVLEHVSLVLNYWSTHESERKYNFDVFTIDLSDSELRTQELSKFDSWTYEESVFGVAYHPQKHHLFLGKHLVTGSFRLYQHMERDWINVLCVHDAENFKFHNRPLAMCFSHDSRLWILSERFLCVFENE